MTSQEIRQKFLDFFKEKGHLIVPSAPLVLKNDPTLMFMNSGMAQFKDFFLGTKAPTSPRIADTQKCLRVTGKHNDLEDVGHDTYHHTLFEMLGNWSFGDYFKKEAIAWSWELLTEVYGLPKERLYATVFEGDASENLEPDTEASELWKQYLPEERILFGNKKDNFWEMGDVGPCGPCSEIHIDLRSEAEIAQKGGRELVNQDHPQVVEIWNNVFMQFERKADKRLVPLPAKHVDTGMGFERLCMAIQGKTSNYDTDVFQPLIQYLAQKSQKTYGQEAMADVALRVAADHIRAITFAIADGQLPSSNGAGYVIRRILRRAVRYGYTYLHFKEPFLYELVAILAEQFASVFPEVQQQQAFIANVIQEEEKSFLKTLETGLKRLDNYTEQQQGQSIDGKTAFELYDTFGFPLDLTALIAREKGIGLDEAGFQKEMEQQKERSRSAASLETDDWVILHQADEIYFIGYDAHQSESRLLRYRQVKEKNKAFYQVVLESTPFYAESGGQVGDKGKFSCIYQGNLISVDVFDTKKENDLIVHFVAEKGFFDFINAAIANNSLINATINTERRAAIMRNHSATHLLQAALKEVLGSHVAQKGSLVNEEVLRFDFAHFSKMSPEELEAVERLVNLKIRENIALEEKRKVPIQEAVEKMGATALFGEKYGDFVRVITFDAAFSRELCGGTHVSATGQIGFLKIISESSVAAGVRRIEAITGAKAEEYIREQLTLVDEIKEILKAKDLKKSIEQLLQEKQSLQKEIEKIELKQAQQEKQSLLIKVEQINGMSCIFSEVAFPSLDIARQISFELKQQVENLFSVFVCIINEKPQIIVTVSEALQSKGLHAGQIVKELAKEIKGGGGGQPFYATAGGSDASALGKVLEKARSYVPQV